MLSLSARVLTQDTQKISLHQPAAISVPGYFERPLEYSRSSISFFLQNTFNHLKYPQEYLALNFGHVSQGISLAPQHHHPRRFVRKVLGLFSLKLHDIYVNPYAWCSFLEDLMKDAGPHMDAEAEKDYILEAFKQAIGACLLEKFDQLRREPARTLHDLSENIYDIAYPQGEQDISIRELQHSLHYFLYQGMSLLVWSPEDQEDTWQSMLAIASRLEQCAEHNLIDYDMLDDLYWALLERYALFLSVAGLELGPEYFEVACSAVQTDRNAFWYDEERELYITTKYEFLRKALIQAAASSQLTDAGYVQFT